MGKALPNIGTMGCRVSSGYGMLGMPHLAWMSESWMLESMDVRKLAWMLESNPVIIAVGSHRTLLSVSTSSDKSCMFQNAAGSDQKVAGLQLEMILVVMITKDCK
jgi:hypothetical protein